MIIGKIDDCFRNVFLKSNFGSSIKAIRKASTHLTEEPFLFFIIKEAKQTVC